MNTDGTGFHTCKECHKTESLWNHTTTDHKEGEQLKDRISVGASSCNCGDGTDQRVQSLIFIMMMMNFWVRCTVQLKCEGTRWCTGVEVKGKLTNAVGSQYPSHYLGTRCIQHYYRWCAHLSWSVVDWTDALADLNGLVRFAERRKIIPHLPLRIYKIILN